MATFSAQLSRQLGDLAQTLDAFQRIELIDAMNLVTTANAEDNAPIKSWEDPRLPAASLATIHRFASEPVYAAGSATAAFALTSPEVAATSRFTKDLLQPVMWLVTVHPLGKWATRYRSTGSLAGAAPSDLRHEHVFTRRSIIAELMALDPEDAVREKAERILREKAIGCVVTVDEHTRLTKFDRSHDGWDRYAAASVHVIDRFTGSAMVLAP